MPITFDKVNKWIVVTIPDTEVTIQDLIDAIRDYEDELVNLDIPKIADCTGKEELGGGVYVGLTLKLIDWKLKFEDRPGPDYVTCNVRGGNLVAYDTTAEEYVNPIEPSAYVTVTLTASSSATLQELTSIQYSSFNGGVTIDVTSPYSGTEFPVGTLQEPVNNLADAMLIANERGFDVIYVRGDLTIDSQSGDYSGIIFIGESMTKTNITVESDANVTDCEFENANVSGTLDGNCKLYQCRIGDLNYIYGVIESCMLQGTITLGGENPAHFLDCWSGIAGGTIPVIDLGGSGQDLSLRNYNGGIKLINKSGTDKVSIDLNSGHVILDSTVTNGEITIRGVGKVTDNSTATVDVTHLLNPSIISDQVWDETASEHETEGTMGALQASGGSGGATAEQVWLEETSKYQTKPGTMGHRLKHLSGAFTKKIIQKGVWTKKEKETLIKGVTELLNKIKEVEEKEKKMEEKEALSQEFKKLTQVLEKIKSEPVKVQVPDNSKLLQQILKITKDLKEEKREQKITYITRLEELSDKVNKIEEKTLVVDNKNEIKEMKSDMREMIRLLVKALPDDKLEEMVKLCEKN